LRQNVSTTDKLLSTEYPLIWCCQLSSALKHLHENRLTHPDLAARNCQLTSNLTLKLGDYGLAVLQYPEDYYQGAPGVSVRWCAPESLSYTSTTIQPKKITLEANIWSLAVTMWEICECGEQPYSSLSDDEVISLVLGSQKVRLNRPKYHLVYTDYM
jgi:serine/threonine protein kinase